MISMIVGMVMALTGFCIYACYIAMNFAITGQNTETPEWVSRSAAVAAVVYIVAIVIEVAWGLISDSERNFYK